MRQAVSGQDELDTNVTPSSSNCESTIAGSCNNGQLPKHASLNATQTFTSRYNLAQHADIFYKAELILQGDTISERISLNETEERALQDETNYKWRQPKMLYFTMLLCSIGAIEQGWAQTGMNGANLYFPKAFGIDSNNNHDKLIVGLINSGIYLSTGLLGAWLSDPVNNRLGRRGAIFLGSAICLISNLGSSLSRSWQQLLAFRFILGLGLGINASTVSVYAAECAPANIRGGLAVSWQMWVAFGLFLGFVLNAAAYQYGEDAWRLQLAGPIIPTVPLLTLLYMCPESPAWFLKKGRRFDLAFQSLCLLRNTELQAAKELYATYLQGLATYKASNQVERTFSRKLLDMILIPRIRRATVASYVVMLSQQLCGINITAFYSSTVFSNAGFSDFGALLASCVFGFVNFVGAFPAIWTMDTWGRRSLLLLTLPLMAITMLATAFTFGIPAENPLHLGLLATFIYLFCALYSPGMGPVPPAYSAEVFPLSHREVGMSFAIATSNSWASIFAFIFPKLLTVLGSQGTFVLYAGLNILATVLVFLFLPETRLKTLDELDDVFSIPTRTFISYQIKEYLPWFLERYVLRHQSAELPPLVANSEYLELDQGDNDDED